MKLFRRAWRVQVGSLDASTLACKFKVQRTLAMGRAGHAEIVIYGLSPEHRREIISAPRRRTFVELHAGYQDGQSLLFRGDLRKAVQARDGTEWSVTVTAGDGEHAIRNARVSRSFAAGTTLSTVVRAIADAMGVGVGNALDAFRGASLGAVGDTFPEGTLVHGLAAAELTRLCDSTRLTWSVQDGNLQVLPLGGALAREAIRLSADSGLVGAPEIVNRRTVNVKTLMIPGAVPGQQVVLDSAVISGVWRISEAEYVGDTHGSDWGAALVMHRPRPPLLGPVSQGGIG